MLSLKFFFQRVNRGSKKFAQHSVNGCHNLRYILLEWSLSEWFFSVFYKVMNSIPSEWFHSTSCEYNVRFTRFVYIYFDTLRITNCLFFLTKQNFSTTWKQLFRNCPGLKIVDLNLSQKSPFKLATWLWDIIPHSSWSLDYQVIQRGKCIMNISLMTAYIQSNNISATWLSL